MFAGYAFAQQPFATSVGFYYTASTADTAIAADAASTLAAFRATAAENAVTQDAASSGFSIFSAAADAATAQDEALSKVSYPNFTADQAAIFDQAQALPNYPATASESATALDGARLNVTVFVFALETALALDSALFRYRWEPVNDEQTANWTDVLVFPAITISREVATFAGGTFGGFPFAGTYNQTFVPLITVWEEVPSSQNPGWTNINAFS